MIQIEKLSSLQPVCLVATGRSGSDYFQSLLDGHPEVLTFNLHFRFLTEYLPTANTWRNSETILGDFIDEFIGKNLERLVTIYQEHENLDKLGKERNQSLRIDTFIFKKYFLELLTGSHIDQRLVLLAIYGAYNLSLGRKLSDMKVFFHHAHNIHEAKKFKEVFPNAKLITTIRDPRSAIVSANKIACNPKNREWDNYRNFYISLCNTIFEDPSANSFFLKVLRQDIAFGPVQNKILIKSLDKDALLVRLEDIPKKEFLCALADYLGIKYLPSLELSTWGGLEWWGDSLSSKKLSPSGWMENKTYNGWRKELSRKDLYIINNVLNDILLKRGYEVNQITNLSLFNSMFLLLLPLRLELRYLDPITILKTVIKGNMRQKIHAISFPIFFIKVRIMLFLFLHAQITGVWKEWPGTILGKKETPSNGIR
tara:strand:- start:2424 stop:3701 length:1278 start_codon:yes stop_codon:yes gene_type:complete